MSCKLIAEFGNTFPTFQQLAQITTRFKTIKRKTHYVDRGSSSPLPHSHNNQTTATTNSHMDQMNHMNHSNQCAAVLPLPHSSYTSYPLPSPPTYINERLCLIYAAVSMVEQSGRRKVSVRRAAAHFGVPKSTVHRHLQVYRGIIPRRRRPHSTTCSPPRKCDINFLIHHQDNNVAGEEFRTSFTMTHSSSSLFQENILG